MRTRCEKVLFELEMEDGEQDGEMCVRFISCNTCFNYLIFDIIRQLLQKSSESGMDGRISGETAATPGTIRTEN